MNRFWVVCAALGLAGTVVAVSVPVLTYARMRQAERSAAEALTAIGAAQRAFRDAGGRGGYAADLASLTTPCPDATRGALIADPLATAHGYVFALRAARDAGAAGRDCHGRQTVTDYYAAARPASELTGRQALAMQSSSRIYVFFEGIPPVESDMAAGGLAVPLDSLDTFKIP